MAQDLYQKVTDQILAALENGVAPWVRPWVRMAPHGGAPYNAVTGKPYRGINTLLLFAPAYPQNAWMTFNQAKSLGANVRKGEHGSMIVFYKPFVVEDKNAAPVVGGDDPRTRTIPLLRAYTVFNVAQIENLPEKYLASTEVNEAERPAQSVADTMMGLATVVHGGDRASYYTNGDYIRMPQPAQFRSVAEYHGTGLHELTHWTGHSSRCARTFGKTFGDANYAKEELVAEMGAAFLCAHAGIDGKLQHVEYIGSWIACLKSDKRAIVVAAGMAQKAADFVLTAAGLSHPVAADEPVAA